MRLPSWNEFKSQVIKFEKEVNEKIIQFKDDHPLMDKAIHQALGFLPPPINGVAQNIYDSFQGSEEEKSEQVIHYLKYLQSQGEQHYNKIAIKLDQILINVNDIKEISSKETTLLQIKDIMISGMENVEDKLNNLNNEIIKTKNELGGKLDDVGKNILENKKYLEEILYRLPIPETIQIGDKKEIPDEYKKKIPKLFSDEISLSINDFLKLGNSFYFMKNYSQAIKIYDVVLSNDPNNVYALIDKSVVLFELLEYRQVLDVVEKILQIVPDHPIGLTNKCGALVNLGQYQEALDVANKALQVEPDNVFALANKCGALAFMEQYQEALDVANKALQVAPDHPIALINKSLPLIVLEQYQEALDVLNKALQVAPDHPIALANKSNLLVRLDQYQEALDVANKALQVAPDHPLALANKSAALAGLDQYQEALDVANKALQVEPDNPLVRFVISHCKANLNSD